MNVMREQIETWLREVLKGVPMYDYELVDDPKVTLLEMGCDSLEVTELIIAIEEQYGIFIPENVLIEWTMTIPEIAATVEDVINRFRSGEITGP